nr:MAG TPA: hypothetical protein [Caudoviricetes sp.]
MPLVVSWGSKGDIAPRGAAKTTARRRREGSCR